MCSKKIFIFLISAFFLFIFPLKVSASVMINEFSPSTDSEWIELYNDGDTEIDLSGYLLEDGNSSKTDDLNLNGILSSKGYIVFTHTEGWLNNSGDTIKLYNNATPSAIIDQYTYGNVDSTKSVARIPNGSENWQITSNITNNSINPSPSPTPTNSPTTAPTQAPTSVPTVIPTVKPTPTKTATSKPTVTPTQSSEPEQTDNPENLTIQQLNNPTTTPIGMVAGATTTKKSPIVAIILIISGIGFLGYGGYLLYNIKHAKIENYS